ncbi:MAG: alpha/beta fold hydrolase [Actinomycetota bacterium]
MTSGRSLFIDVQLPFMSGLRIAIRVQGKGDPLLLMNGMTRPMRSWANVIGGLEDRTVVSFDAPGVGASPTSVRPLSIAELATVAESVLDAAGFADADVLGYSHGGAVAQELAHQAPDRVRGLILAATSCGMGATPGAGQDMLRSLGVPRVASPWPLPDPLGFLWQSMAVSSWSSIPFLGSIRSRTLVVCGSRDRVVPPSNSRVLARRIPGASLVMLQGAGHDLQRVESSSALVPILRSFLDAGFATETLRAV